MALENRDPGTDSKNKAIEGVKKMKKKGRRPSSSSSSSTPLPTTTATTDDATAKKGTPFRHERWFFSVWIMPWGLDQTKSIPNESLSLQTSGAFHLESACICLSKPIAKKKHAKEEKKTHTPPAMPPASSDLAMDAAESVLWFLARSSWALVVLLGPLVVVVAAADDAEGDDGAAICS